MARGVNKTIIVGTLGADPEVRYTKGGVAVATFSLATNESWTDKQSGKKKERVEWHRVKAFDRQGEVIGEFARKGKQLYVEGQLRTDKYTDKDGIERYTTYIIARDFQFLGSADRDDDREGSGNQPSRNESSRNQGQAGKSSQQRSAPPPTPPPLDNFDDDDIPF